jgi:hypothetical protein
VGDENGFKIPSADASLSSKSDIFPDNPARRVSVTGSKPRPPRDNKIKAANESDVSQSFPRAWGLGMVGGESERREADMTRSKRVMLKTPECLTWSTV